MTNPITIVPFRDELAPAFASLNRAWIEQFFAMEPSDWKVLLEPQAAILAPGGQVFFAMDGHVAVGTAAAIRIDGDTYELAKMAVSPSHQGRGIGELLGHAVIAWTRTTRARLLTLETNHKLAGAIRLYERLGFHHAISPTPSEYARADVYMELVL